MAILIAGGTARFQINNWVGPGASPGLPLALFRISVAAGALARGDTNLGATVEAPGFSPANDATTQ